MFSTDFVDGRREMAYRERVAWLSLAAKAVAYIPYFITVGAIARSPIAG
jgi:hypothetical protein